MESKPASPVPPASYLQVPAPASLGDGLWPGGMECMNLPTLIVFTVAEKQEDSLKFEASLEYTARLCLKKKRINI